MNPDPLEIPVKNESNPVKNESGIGDEVSGQICALAAAGKNRQLTNPTSSAVENAGTRDYYSPRRWN
jgi:hypothetical protein